MPLQDTALILREIEKRLPDLRVLLIDRTIRSRETLGHMLNALGITRITAVSTAADALKQIAATPFDLFFSEHHLEEGSDGHQLLESLRQGGLISRAAVYFVVTTERSHAQVTSIAELAPDDYLIKPFNTEQLQSRLLQALYRKQHVLRAVFQALDRHDYQAAIDACNAVSGQHPAFLLDTLRVKGELLNILGLHSAAELLYTDVIRQKPLPWARRGMAQALYERGLLEEAAKLATALIQETPEFLATYDFLARILEQQGRHDAAQATLQQAADMSPLNSERQRIVGEFAARNNDWPTASRAFSKVLERKRGTPMSHAEDYSNLALVLLEQRNVDSARRLARSLEREMRGDPLGRLAGLVIESLCAHQEQDSRTAGHKLEEALAARETLQQDKSAPPLPARLGCDLAHACMAAGKTEAAHALLRELAGTHHDAPQTVARIKSVFARHDQLEAGQALMAAVSHEMIELNNRGVQAAQGGNLRESVRLLMETADQVPNLQFQVNAAKAIFTLLGNEGWDAPLAERGLYYLKRAWHQDRNSSRVSSARALYVQTASRCSQPVEAF